MSTAEHFSAPKVGLARLVELATAWRVAVDQLARHRWNEWRERIKDANPHWPEWEMTDDGDGQQDEYKASFLADAERDLLAAAKAIHPVPRG